jgi:hypothetical protein
MKSQKNTWTGYHDLSVCGHHPNCLLLFLKSKNWYFITKIVLIYCEKKCCSDQENILKLKAEDREFAKHLRSPEQSI